MDAKNPIAGPVKESTAECYICDENGQEVLDSKVITDYNRDNQITEIQVFDANNELAETSSYTYDENLNLLEIIVKTADGEVKQDIIYTYQDQKLIQTTETAADYRIVTKFDDHDYPLEKQNLAEENTPYSSTKYINLYDENVRLVEKHTVFPMGETDWVDKYQYDAAGRLIEEQKLRHQITSIVRYQYNSQGDLILSDYNPGQSNHETLKRDIVYGPNNDILEIKEYRQGWWYQDNNDFVLNSITRYSYVR